MSKDCLITSTTCDPSKSIFDMSIIQIRMDAISTEHIYVVKRIGVDLHIATGFAKVNTRPMAMTTVKMRCCAGRGIFIFGRVDQTSAARYPNSCDPP